MSPESQQQPMKDRLTEEESSDPEEFTETLSSTTVMSTGVIEGDEEIILQITTPIMSPSSEAAASSPLATSSATIPQPLAALGVAAVANTNVNSSSSPTSLNTVAAKDSAMPPPNNANNQNKKTDRKPSTVQHTIATQGAAGVSTVLLYPLDVVKLRFMSQDGTEARKHNNKYYTSTVSSLKDIYKSEGVGALYKGCHVAVLGSIFAWGAYMYLYRALTVMVLHDEGKKNSSSNNKTSDSSSDFLARSLLSITASSLASCLTCPVFLIKTRMQVEDKSRAFAAAQQRAAQAAAGGVTATTAAAAVATEKLHYTTFRASFLRIVQTTGYASLWRGLTAQLMLGVPNALHFPIYDTLKAWRLRQYNAHLGSGDSAVGDNGAPLRRKEFLDDSEVFVCSTITKLLLMTMTHPLFVLKTRMQDHRAHQGEVKYQGFVRSFAITCKREGLRGFYRGTIPSVMQAVPRSVLHTFVYEKLLQAQIKTGVFA